MKSFGRIANNLPSLLFLTLFAVVCVIGFATSRARTTATQDTDVDKKYKTFGVKRKFRQRIDKDAPLEVVSVKNIDAREEEWISGLEIEVKNISDKPVYHILMYLEFPDVKYPGYDYGSGFYVSYGASRLSDIREVARPEDVPIKPGETYSFKIPEGRAQGVQSMKQSFQLTSQQMGNIVTHFQNINFGDGTG